MKIKSYNDYIMYNEGKVYLEPNSIANIESNMVNLGVDRFDDSGKKIYKINDDLTIDYYDTLDLSAKQIKIVYLHFNTVYGDVKLYYNKYTNLNNIIQEIKGKFICSTNKLTTLENGPKYVGGDMFVTNNKLTDLHGFPVHLGGCFSCYNNPNLTLNGLPDNYDLTKILFEKQKFHLIANYADEQISKDESLAHKYMWVLIDERCPKEIKDKWSIYIEMNDYMK